ncbi:FAD-dependent oxidoreductase [Deinococcus roseus]|uniref:FAD-dependent oxidoreductase n=1 Tax=Deinococcus roseus TaxID=392414 RepID=A0ABQ2CZV4_9DEIO|nr:NAD(P)/FAD-dependent oxidoreductase [Deinococcus roseus]GGJ36955.1 FAD-dependent oxidoreductase [Deinococcus roseus]
MKPDTLIIVVGAGIAGPTLGMALQQAGFQPTLYESSAETAEGIGAFLTLSTNGIQALRVIRADLPVLKRGFATPELTLRSHTGKFLGKTSTGTPLPDGTSSHTLKRADLYEALYQEALRRGVRFVHGKHLVDATETPEGVTAHFSDGSTATGDLLIGSDGVHSVLRSVIDLHAPRPTYSGLLTTGGYVQNVKVDVPVGSYEMIYGQKGFFGYAPAPNGEVWWFANVPWPREPARGEVECLGSEHWKQHLLQLHAKDQGPILDVLHHTDHLMTMKAIHMLPHLPHWQKGRMLVIGDAAHAPSPSSGQGAALAIEDAVVLAQCLRDAETAEQAFALFEKTRRQRIERIIRWAARINNSKAAGPLGSWFRDLLMPTAMKWLEKSDSQRFIFDHQIHWDTRMNPTV